MDKTSGGFQNWACGSTCPGGAFKTDGSCNCACLKRPVGCNADGSYSSGDDQTVEIVVESFGAMEGALKWADELAKEFADTDGVNDVLNFVKNKRPQLIKYTGNALNANMKLLLDSSERIVMALNDVVYLAYQMEIGAKNTKGLIQE